MRHKGLAKLAEECGELQQVIGKLLQYPELQNDRIMNHPDGSILLDRLEQEIADVSASISFVKGKMKLSESDIQHRHALKLMTFQSWDREK